MHEREIDFDRITIGLTENAHEKLVDWVASNCGER